MPDDVSVSFAAADAAVLKDAAKTLKEADARPKTQTEVGGIAADHLRSFIARIERLEEEKAGLAADIREVYAEAKGSGFDPKVMRRIIKDRAADPTELAEFQALLEVYQMALGI